MSYTYCRCYRGFYSEKAATSMVMLHIKQSKTDTLQESAQVVFGLTGKEVCHLMMLKSAQGRELIKY